ncbi:flavin containing amine oxidoreductase [Indivirus ILV1]|uniref:Flavin containing amine oxidoreductase n=1 Tax=Indivirus ILV1 TaxID=1977633 RepID=A0A1V0SE07_9VIRU|nr:flavin containing amine oxidoreductase [Indivirus ILV1]
MYDYAIIGSGPSGLTLALYLTKYNKKVLLIDKENSIGGCHRVRRVNGLFTEHGPRITVGNYFSFFNILKTIGKEFNDLFVPYNFTVNTALQEGIKILSYSEIMAIVFEFMKFMINENPSKLITMFELTDKYNFSDASKEYLDNLCRLTDGGTLDNFTLFEFFQIFNQNYLYNIYQPKLPNDVGLFKYWKEALDNSGNVTMMLNTEVNSIISNDNIVKYIEANGNKIEAKNYIFAIPPKPMLNIVQNSSNKNIFGEINEFSDWVQKSSYFVYIPIIFHWNRKLKLKKVWGLTKSDYGIVFIVMSDYMNFNDPRSQTVITCTVKFANRKSKFNNKTADECNEKELIDEVFRQLSLYFDNLPQPTFSILSPGVYKKDNKWDTIDTAYFYTKAGYRSNKSIYDNLFWIGTHNGNSHYSFTAMESAVENSINLLHEIVPESKNDIVVQPPITIKFIIFIIILIVIILLLVR